MRAKQFATITIALIFALIGTACGEQAREAMEEVAAEARKQLHEEPITLSHDSGDTKVELTPGGDLLIDGEPVAMDATQREAALAYREKLLDLAETGIIVGQQGAVLGVDAAAVALGALLGGDAEEAERKIEAEAEKISTAALALCDHARALGVEQARFAEILPEFAPFAKEIEIDPDCEDAMDEPVATDTISDQPREG